VTIQIICETYTDFVLSHFQGYRKMRCEIDVNAEQINSNRFSLRGRSLPGRN